MCAAVVVDVSSVPVSTATVSTTVDQFNKKRVLLPQTLDISYSASRKFYFGILNFPVPESIEPAHMWIVDPRAGAGLRNFIFRF